MKAYKGFFKNDDGTLQCRNFVFKEGETYKTDKAVLCWSGFHACLNPLDVFTYYNSNHCGNVEFHEVEIEGVDDERSCDSKVVGKKITIGRKITPDEMVEIGLKMVFENKADNFVYIDYMTIRKDDKFNIVRKDGELLSNEWFHDVYFIGEGNFIARYKKDGRLRALKFGGLVSELEFDYVSKSIHGLYYVVADGKYNFIDSDFKLVSEKWFDKCVINDDILGVARVERDGIWYTLQKDGVFVEYQPQFHKFPHRHKNQL